MTVLNDRYNIECIVLGHLLTFGLNACAVMGDKFRPDMFIYDKDASLCGKGAHREIFSAIRDLYIRGISPSLAQVSTALNNNDEYRLYMKSLQNRLSLQYSVNEFNADSFIVWVNEVDKHGHVYLASNVFKSLAEVTTSPEKFTRYVNDIDDVDRWADEYSHKLNLKSIGNGEDYEHISTAGNSLHERLDRLEKGEQTQILPVGMPSFDSRALIQKGKFIVIHGNSGSGKSALTQTLQLGTAIGLVRYGLPGCVAFNLLEEDRVDLVQKLAATLSGFNTTILYSTDLSDNDRENIKRFRYWVDFVSKLPIYVDDTNLLTSSALRYKAGSLHMGSKGPIQQLSADFVELFGDDENVDSAENKEQKLSNTVRKGILLSRFLDANVIFVSQSTYGMGNNSARIAGPLGTRGSRSIYHLSDVLMEVWNAPEMLKSGIPFDTPVNLDKHHMWVLTQKNKRGPKWEPFPLQWEAEYVRVQDPELRLSNGGMVLFDHLNELGQIKDDKIIPEPENTTIGTS